MHQAAGQALACRFLRTTRRGPPVMVRTRHVSVPVPNDRATRWLYHSATTRIVTTGEALREQLIRDNGIDMTRDEAVANLRTGDREVVLMD